MGAFEILGPICQLGAISTTATRSGTVAALEAAAMSWYDVFSGFYDRSMERLYRGARVSAAEALQLQPGHIVLDLPCGTGQSFDEIAPKIGPAGRLLGVDLSEGMRRKAAARAQKAGWSQVTVLPGDAQRLELAALGAEAAGGVDAVHVFLGLTTFPDYDAAFERIWGCLRPGGRAVVVDVFAERLGFQGRMVNLVARADIRRRTWEPLERCASDFTRTPLPSLPDHGGQLYLAVGTKPHPT